MVGAHLAPPVCCQAADLEALLVKVHARLRVVHILIVLRQAFFHRKTFHVVFASVVRLYSCSFRSRRVLDVSRNEGSCVVLMRFGFIIFMCAPEEYETITPSEGQERERRTSKRRTDEPQRRKQSGTTERERDGDQSVVDALRCVLTGYCVCVGLPTPDASGRGAGVFVNTVRGTVEEGFYRISLKLANR